jgi:hypothetical protein
MQGFNMNLNNPLQFKTKNPANKTENSDALLKQNHKVILDFYRLFNTPEGERVLAFLKSKTLDQPCWNPAYGENAERNAFAREGQNHIVREILKFIEYGKGLNDE